MTKELVGEQWYEVLKPEFEKQYFIDLWATLKKEYSTVKVLPSAKLIFKAFQLTNPSTVKVVIVLQD